MKLNADNVLFTGFISMLVLFAGFLGYAITNSLTQEHNVVTVPVKVLKTEYYKSGKTTSSIPFYVENDRGDQWWSSEGISAYRCPKVIYNEFKPVWHTTTIGGLTKDISRSISGLITFCPQ